MSSSDSKVNPRRSRNVSVEFFAKAAPRTPPTPSTSPPSYVDVDSALSARSKCVSVGFLERHWENALNASGPSPFDSQFRPTRMRLSSARARAMARPPLVERPFEETSRWTRRLFFLSAAASATPTTAPMRFREQSRLVRLHLSCFRTCASARPPASRSLLPARFTVLRADCGFFRSAKSRPFAASAPNALSETSSAVSAEFLARAMKSSVADDSMKMRWCLFCHRRRGPSMLCATFNVFKVPFLRSAAPSAAPVAGPKRLWASDSVVSASLTRSAAPTSTPAASSTSLKRRSTTLSDRFCRSVCAKSSPAELSRRLKRASSLEMEIGYPQKKFDHVVTDVCGSSIAAIKASNVRAPMSPSSARGASTARRHAT
mmetsp:Transcript_9242/g.31842  ORF Transcript_9242/g.31842 Transcript_9242/m.31842 type:complete len:374 (+) Transcript_9242:1710-2831(+)